MSPSGHPLHAKGRLVTRVKILGIQIDFHLPNELVQLQDSPWQMFDVTRLFSTCVGVRSARELDSSHQTTTEGCLGTRMGQGQVGLIHHPQILCVISLVNYALRLGCKRASYSGVISCRPSTQG